MKFKMSLAGFLLFSASAFAQYDEMPVYQDTYQDTVTSTTSGYASNLQLRGERKLGVGAQVGGTSGLFGLNLELNIEEQDGVVTGFGFGDGYSTYSIAWKRNYEGLFFTPYTTLGWSRWFSSAGGKSPDSYMLDAVLRENEKNEGRFGIDYVVGAVGAQYNQLDGELAGASLFTEVSLFFAPARGVLMPSAAVGTSYFF